MGRWYVFGAQAVTAHGVPRLSADVDVTLALTPNDPGQLTRDLEAAGFSARFSDPAFVRQTRVMPFVHVGTAMPRRPRTGGHEGRRRHAVAIWIGGPDDEDSDEGHEIEPFIVFRRRPTQKKTLRSAARPGP